MDQDIFDALDKSGLLYNKDGDDIDITIYPFDIEDYVYLSRNEDYVKQLKESIKYFRDGSAFNESWSDYEANNLKSMFDVNTVIYLATHLQNHYSAVAAKLQIVLDEYVRLEAA